MINLSMQHKFKKHIMDPILEEKSLILAPIVRSIIRKISNGNLSSYATDSTLFHIRCKRVTLKIDCKDESIMSNPINDDYEKIKENFLGYKITRHINYPRKKN